MNVRRILLIVAAVGVAGGTARFVHSVVDGAAQPRIVEGVVVAPAPAPVVVKRVLVAASDLPAGQLVGKDHLRWHVWPEEAIDERYAVEGVATLDAFQGAVVRQGLRAGEPILAGRLVKPGERGFLAAVLNPDMRAVSVPINAVTGIAGLMFPGDRVDVILTHAFDPNMESEQAVKRRASETVLADVRVLAIDQRVSDQQDKPAPGQIATLEVTPDQAERLTLVAELGQLSLILRSVARTDAMPVQLAANGAAAVEAAASARSGVVPAALPEFPTVPARPSNVWDSEVSRLMPPVRRQVPVKVFRGKDASEMRFER